MALASGTAISQLIYVAATPVLSRLYSPEEMGRFGLFQAFVTFAALAATLRYESAIVTPKEERGAAYLALISVVLCLPISAILAVGFVALSEGSILGFELLPASTGIAVLFALVFSSLFAVLRFWLIRQDRFDLIARVTVYQNLGRVVSQIGCGLAGFGWIGLVVGEVIGRMTGAGRMLRDSFRGIVKHVIPFERRHAVRILTMHRDFPMYNLPSSLLNGLALALPTPLIAGAYGMGAAGHFAIIHRILQLPLYLLGKSVADVFHARCAAYAHDDPAQVLPFFDRMMRVLAIMGLVPLVAVMVIGNRVIEWVLGPAWELAGDLAVAMAPWAFAQFAVSPLSRIVLVLGGQRQKLAFDITSLAAVVLSITLSEAYKLSVIGAVWVLSAGQCVSYGIYYVILRTVAVRSEAHTNQTIPA